MTSGFPHRCAWLTSRSAIDRDGVRIAYESLVPHEPRPGSPVVILLAALATSGRLYSQSAGSIAAAGYRVIVVDGRGCGRSATPPWPWTTSTCAADVIAVLDQERVARAHMSGASLGGMVAQEIAIRYPERVGALCLSATTGGMPRIDCYDTGGTSAAIGRYLYALAGRPSRQDAIRQTASLWLTEEFAARLKEGGDAWQVLASLRAERSSRWALLAQIGALLRHSSWRQLPAIQAPTLILHGTVDRMISPRAAAALARRIRRRELRLLPGVGHAIGLQVPELAVELGLAFVRRHDHLLSETVDGCGAPPRARPPA